MLSFLCVQSGAAQGIRETKRIISGVNLGEHREQNRTAVQTGKQQVEQEKTWADPDTELAKGVGITVLFFKE